MDSSDTDDDNQLDRMLRRHSRSSFFLEQISRCATGSSNSTGQNNNETTTTTPPKKSCIVTLFETNYGESSVTPEEIAVAIAAVANSSNSDNTNSDDDPDDVDLFGDNIALSHFVDEHEFDREVERLYINLERLIGNDLVDGLFDGEDLLDSDDPVADMFRQLSYTMVSIPHMVKKIVRADRENGDVDCAICLETVQVGAHCCQCLHKFCMRCLRRWMKIRRNCPLCTVELNYIIYNVRSEAVYSVLEDVVGQRSPRCTKSPFNTFKLLLRRRYPDGLPNMDSVYERLEQAALEEEQIRSAQRQAAAARRAQRQSSSSSLTRSQRRRQRRQERAALQRQQQQQPLANVYWYLWQIVGQIVQTATDFVFGLFRNVRQIIEPY